MDGTGITISVHDTIGAIGAAVWDACACPEAGDGGRPNDPFTTYRFLKALEDSGSVGPGTGWRQHYLTAETGGQVVGCAPLYLKTDSHGEYIFDFNWAHAYEGAGGRYYPKLQIAVPFTPVTGRRPADPSGVRGRGAPGADKRRGRTGGTQQAVIAAYHLLHRGRGAGGCRHGPDAARQPAVSLVK